jgi:hypothetical protein
MAKLTEAQRREATYNKRIADARAAKAKHEQAVLDAVAVAWHNLAPQLVAQAQRNGDPLFVWAQAQHLLADALALPEAHHTCSGITCKFGYAHAAGL